MSVRGAAFGEGAGALPSSGDAPARYREGSMPPRPFSFTRNIITTVCLKSIKAVEGKAFRHERAG